MTKKIKLNKGDSVWFAACKKPFKVRAANDRFAICTQPYNFKPKTVIYTIIDFERNVRGLDNMVLGIYSYYTDEECVAALQDLINGTMEVGKFTIMESYTGKTRVGFSGCGWWIDVDRVKYFMVITRPEEV